MSLSSSVLKHTWFPAAAEVACYESQVASLRDSAKSMGKLRVLAWMFEKHEEKIVCRANWSRLAYTKAQGI